MASSSASNSSLFTPAAWMLEGILNCSTYFRAVRMRLRALWRTLELSRPSRRAILAYRLATGVRLSEQPALKLIT